MLPVLGHYQMHHSPNQPNLKWQDPLKVFSENQPAFCKVYPAPGGNYIFFYEPLSHKSWGKRQNGYGLVIARVIFCLFCVFIDEIETNNAFAPSPRFIKM
jgi:hypothetical protein